MNNFFSWALCPLIIVLIIIAVLLVIALILLAAAGLCYSFAFGKRCDKNALLKYFTAEDYDLSAESISVQSGNTLLRGYVYKKTDVKPNGKVVVFCHGMGPGQIAYTTEIAYFCNLGYIVAALDSKGCNLSEGKNIGGMFEGVKTAAAAVTFARENIPNTGIYLVGHSWGAYSALCASALVGADKVVALSAPDTPVRTIYEGAALIISKPVAAVLYPFWYIINALKFGARGNISASESILKNNSKIMLIHGTADKVVTPSKAVFYSRASGNAIKLSAEGKGHNPYNTVKAEQKLAELTSALKNSHKMSETEKAEYFGSFDFKAAVEEDEEVMRSIAEFLENY